MTKQSKTIILLLIITCLEGFYIIGTSSRKDLDDELIKSFRKRSKIISVPLPQKLQFAGEDVPLNLHYVHEGLDRELTVNTYWPASTLNIIKRANRYLPVIEPILERNGIPNDFKYLAMIESSLSNVVSPAGAAGYWQLLAETAKGYGLKVTEEVDERYHLEKATEAACKLLKHSYGLYGNWTLAAAAYNAGEGRISRETDRQRVDNYYDLNLVEESTRYMFRILALKILFEHPTDYGFYLRNIDLYPPVPTYSITVDSSITDMIGFAFKQNITYRMLREYNPWLRKEKVTNLNKIQYTFKIPQKEYLDENRLMKSIADPSKIFADTATLIDQ